MTGVNLKSLSVVVTYSLAALIYLYCTTLFVIPVAPTAARAPLAELQAVTMAQVQTCNDKYVRINWQQTKNTH